MFEDREGNESAIVSSPVVILGVGVDRQGVRSQDIIEDNA